MAVGRQEASGHIRQKTWRKMAEAGVRQDHLLDMPGDRICSPEEVSSETTVKMAQSFQSGSDSQRRVASLEKIWYRKRETDGIEGLL